MNKYRGKVYSICLIMLGLIIIAPDLSKGLGLAVIGMGLLACLFIWK